jgi:hypothetical protein
MPSAGIVEHNACLTLVKSTARTVEIDICSAIAAYTVGIETPEPEPEPQPEPGAGGLVFQAGVFVAGVFE